ncbi:MAG: PilZ domain-containing protein [Bryobacterales bacterium]|nr:PilZ domain-containing protein [Bryobacterales bacterium]
MQPNSHLIVERRSKARFAVQLGVRYRTLATAPALAGVGQTVNISSRGLLIACDSGLYPGASLELTVDWPLLLHGTTALQLIVYCHVTRCQSNEFAVKLERYQFRTKKRYTEAVKFA